MAKSRITLKTKLTNIYRKSAQPAAPGPDSAQSGKGDQNEEPSAPPCRLVLRPKWGVEVDREVDAQRNRRIERQRKFRERLTTIFRRAAKKESHEDFQRRMSLRKKFKQASRDRDK